MDTLCEKCAYFEYDDELEDYVCNAFMDEDDKAAYSENPFGCKKEMCRGFRPYDEYGMVKKQN